MISEKLRHELVTFLKEQKKADLLTAYLYFFEKKEGLKPVVYLPGKTIYRSADSALEILEAEGKVWREAEIKIGVGPQAVNEETKKVYICPFSGKIFGDNTHANPQDAIYDWVSKCPENTERSGGVRTKRFFVSDDPDVIKNYIKPVKTPISKTVFSSVATGKLYQNKQSVINEFKKTTLKPMTLVEVQNQNRFQMDEAFLSFVNEHLQEEKIAAFVEALAEHDEFHPFVSEWVEA